MAGNGLSAETRAAIRKWAPKLDAKVVKRTGVSGEALLGKLVMGESGDDPNAVSPAGAKGRTQFMPGSRKTAMQKFGIDPWRSADEAIHAAVLHLNGKINGSKGLEGYNPGDPSYPDYILSRKVGNLGAGRGAPPTVGSGYTTKTLKQTSIQTSSDDEGAIIDSLLAGKSGRQGASLASDIATRLGSGNYTTETPVTTTSKVRVPTVGQTQGTDAQRPSGKVTLAATANRKGHGLQSYTTDFVDRMTKWAGNLTIGTGTNHNQMTVNGNVSDHWDGSAADIPATGKRGDAIAYAAFRAAGVSEKKARQWASAGGLYNVNRDGVRYQIIWKTNEGGNHFNHVHVGVRPT